MGEGMNMTAEEKLKKKAVWANSSHGFLSESTEKAKGFKAGIYTAKNIVLDILHENRSLWD